MAHYLLPWTGWYLALIYVVAATDGTTTEYWAAATIREEVAPEVQKMLPPAEGLLQRWPASKRVNS